MLRFLACLLVACVSVSSLRAASSEWIETDGTRFKGEPAAVFGSLALFRTSDSVLRRVPLRNLSEDDCRRFYQAIAAKPARAATWAGATGRAAAELPGAVYKLDMQYRRMVPADLRDVPEPELIFLIVGSHSNGASWTMLGNLMPFYHRMQRVYPGVVGTVFFGRAHTAVEHKRMSVEMWTPWFSTDYDSQHLMTMLDRRAPRDRAAMLVLTRDGDLVMSTPMAGMESARKFADDFTMLLWAANPANNSAWSDLTHYGKVARPLEFANSATGPLLVGNPLKAEGLRQRGIGRIVARLAIDAEGKVTSTVLQPGSSVPENLAGQLTEAISHNAVVLPAIDHGKAIASTYDYVMEVPPADQTAEADAAWLDGTIRGELPLLDWAVLKPIPVNQREFDEISAVDSSGKVTLQAVETNQAKVSKASQLSAFNSDWFGEAGAGSVVPKIGEKLTIDGATVVWRALHTDNGSVDMQIGESRNRDYSVGYAWTEIEVGAAMRAWLSVGSDEGIKVWHNGVLVHDHWVKRSNQADGDIVPLRLKAGKNQILIKTQNSTGDWAFNTRLRYRAK